MAYREGNPPNEETVDSYSVSVTKGAEGTGCLLAIVIMFLVAMVTRWLTETPKEIEAIAWTFPVGAGLFMIPTLWLWLKRRRKLLIVRTGDVVKMLVPGDVELTFPLSISGNQVTVTMRGVPTYHVQLKLSDAKQQAILLTEVRGAVHGKQEDWLTAVDRSVAAASFDLPGAGNAARIRARVEELNGKR